MIGIRGFGVHIPSYRLSAQTLAAVWGGGGGGERAVANHDEDSLTMAIEAGLAALGERPGRDLDGVVLASTTPPYAEKSLAALAATVLDANARVLRRRPRREPPRRHDGTPARPRRGAGRLGGERAGRGGRRARRSAGRRPGAAPRGRRRGAAGGQGDDVLAPPRGRPFDHPGILGRLADGGRALSRAGRPDVRARLWLREADPGAGEGRSGAWPQATGRRARGVLRPRRSPRPRHLAEPQVPRHGAAPAAAPRLGRQHRHRLPAARAGGRARGSPAGGAPARRRLRLGGRRAHVPGDRADRGMGPAGRAPRPVAGRPAAGPLRQAPPVPPACRNRGHPRVHEPPGAPARGAAGPAPLRPEVRRLRGDPVPPAPVCWKCSGTAFADHRLAPAAASSRSPATTSSRRQTRRPPWWRPTSRGAAASTRR